MSEFLDRFVKSNPNHATDPHAKYVFIHDKWDKKVADKIAKEIKAFPKAKEKLAEYTPTSHEAIVDTLFSLFKADPVLKDKSEIRPSYLVDHAVMSEMMDLNEYEKLRLGAMGDPITAAMATVDMEPTLETLFDQLSEAKNQAMSLEEMLAAGESMQADAEELMAAAQEAAENGDPAAAQNFQEQAEAIFEQMEALAQQIQKETQTLENLLEMEMPNIKETLQNGLKEASEKADTMNAFTSWGLNQGTLGKIDPDTRIELSKKLDSERFRRMADIFGKMQTLAVTAQLHKTNDSPEEVYDIELGNNIARLTSNELINLSDDDLDWDALVRYVDSNLAQYALKGTEHVEKGGIIILEDGSGSMAGERCIWSKAIALALLKIAFMQNREFYAVQFGGPGQYCEFDFDTTSSILKLDIRYGNDEKHYEGVEALIEFADKFLSMAGTDFMTPFSVAIDRLKLQFEERGAVEADIVFLTDGQCAVSPAWMQEYHQAQADLEFKTYGIVIGGSTDSEPINELCGGKVIEMLELTKMDKLGPLFGDI